MCVCRYTVDVYHSGVIKRTNINLDTQLVGEAADLLGTTRTSDTVHALSLIHI